MPRHYRRSKRRRTNKKRRRPRRKRRTRKRSRVPRLITPYSKVVRLRYVTSITLNVGTDGYPAIHTFRLNSINDPDWTATGHQPMGRDEWAFLYRSSTVLATKASWTARNNIAGQSESAYVGTLVAAGNATFPYPVSDFVEIMESPEVNLKLITDRSQEGGKSINRGSRKFNIRKKLQVNNLTTGTAQYTESLASSSVLTDSHVLFWTIMATPATIDFDIGAIPFVVTLEFITRLTNPFFQLTS